MVIRFDRSDAIGKEAKGLSHYSGFILPGDAVLSELLALLPERCDLLKVRGVVWAIYAEKRPERPFGALLVDEDGTYDLSLVGSDAPASALPGGKLFARAVFSGDLPQDEADAKQCFARLKRSEGLF